LEKAASAHRLRDVARTRRRQELQEFGAHALAREPCESIARADRRQQAFGVEAVCREAGREPKEPQNAQVVLANPRVRFADEAHSSRAEFLEAATVIVDRPVGAERERIDGEIAPPGVGDEVASKRHLGPPPIGLDVLTQRRRFERAPIDDDRHRSVRDASQSNLEPRSSRAADDDVGRRGGCEVEIDHWFAEREIPHCAADEPGLLALTVKHFKRSGERPLIEERLILKPAVRKTRKGGHSKRPGTSTPFSTCAGTYTPRPRGARALIAVRPSKAAAKPTRVITDTRPRVQCSTSSG